MTDEHEDCDCPICSGEMTLAEYQAAILKNIDEFGLHVTGVYASPDSPGFTYTIGMHRHGYPDLVGFSFPHDYSMFLMNWLYAEAKAGRLKLEDGTVISNPEVARYPLVLKATDPDIAAEYVTGSNRLSTKETGSANAVLQVVWSDEASRFPWDPGFDPKFEGKQAKLWYTRN